MSSLSLDLLFCSCKDDDFIERNNTMSLGLTDNVFVIARLPRVLPSRGLWWLLKILRPEEEKLCWNGEFDIISSLYIIDLWANSVILEMNLPEGEKDWQAIIRFDSTF